MVVLKCYWFAYFGLLGFVIVMVDHQGRHARLLLHCHFILISIPMNNQLK